MLLLLFCCFSALSFATILLILESISPTITFRSNNYCSKELVDCYVTNICTSISIFARLWFIITSSFIGLVEASSSILVLKSFCYSICYCKNLIRLSLTECSARCFVNSYFRKMFSFWNLRTRPAQVMLLKGSICFLINSFIEI